MTKLDQETKTDEHPASQVDTDFGQSISYHAGRLAIAVHYSITCGHLNWVIGRTPPNWMWISNRHEWSGYDKTRED